MANLTTTTTQIDHPVDVYYDRLLLERTTPLLVHAQFGQMRNIPNKSGDTIKFRRYASLSVATTPLTEGEDPNAQQISKTDILAQVAWYGTFVKVTDRVSLTVADAVTSEIVEILGENRGETIDELTRDVLGATASSTTCSNGTGTATLLNRTDIDTVVQTLYGNRAKFITSSLKASTGQGTAPIRPSYMGILDTDLIDDLEVVSGYKNTVEYGNWTNLYEGEWGATGNVRWIATDKGYTSSTNYHCPIIGKNAYGVTSIDMGTAELIHHTPKEAGSALEMYETLGWKQPHVARILNDNFIHVLICTNG